MQQQNKQKEIKKQYLFKNWAPLTDCVSKITHTDTDNAKDLDDVMLYIIGQNIGIIIHKHMGVYGNVTEMSQKIL